MSDVERYKQPNLLLPEDGIDVKKAYSILLRHAKIILAIACVGAFLGFLYTFTIVPQYQTSGLLQIKTKANNSTSLLNKLSAYNTSKELEINTLEALIRTRYMLEPVIVATGLNVSASPHYFPHFGAWLARHYHGAGLAKPLFGLKNYAWGGEEIKVAEFLVSPHEENQSFWLVVGKNDTYKLFSSQGKLMLVGRVGEKASNPTYPGLSLELSELRARPGTEFTISHSTPLSFVKQVSNRLQISNIHGEDGTQGTGIFQIGLTDTNPAQAITTLNALITHIVKQNISDNNQENQETLAFIDKRLPVLKNDLLAAENNLNQYHIQHNIISMDMVASRIAQKYDDLEKQIADAKLNQKALLQNYTAIHPLVIEAKNKEKELHEQLAKLEEQIKQYPLINQKEIDLLRERKIRESLYTSLLDLKEKMAVSHAVDTSDIVVISDAIPISGVPIHRLLIIFTGFLMGTLFASTMALIKGVLTKTVESAEQLEDAVHVEVRAVLPFSRKQKELEKLNKKTAHELGTAFIKPLVLAKKFPDDITIEGLRSLKINLHFTKPVVGNHIMSIMGSVTNVGKSFVSANLAQLIADSGKKTLLIDADVRKGRLHHVFHKTKAKGLSEYLEGKYERYEEVLHRIDDHLFFMTCGVYTDHPLKLFQSQRFRDLIALLHQQYDQILIDTPPILPVSDSVLIAELCHTKLFVVSAGKDTIQDVKHAVRKAEAHDIKIDGIILNYRSASSAHGSFHKYRYTYGETTTTA